MNNSENSNLKSGDLIKGYCNFKFAILRNMDKDIQIFHVYDTEIYSSNYKEHYFLLLKKIDDIFYPMFEALSSFGEIIYIMLLPAKF